MENNIEQKETSNIKKYVLFTIFYLCLVFITFIILEEPINSKSYYSDLYISLAVLILTILVIYMFYRISNKNYSVFIIFSIIVSSGFFYYLGDTLLNYINVSVYLDKDSTKRSFIYSSYFSPKNCQLKIIELSKTKENTFCNDKNIITGEIKSEVSDNAVRGRTISSIPIFNSDRIKDQKYLDEGKTYVYENGYFVKFKDYMYRDLYNNKDEKVTTFTNADNIFLFYDGSYLIKSFGGGEVVSSKLFDSNNNLIKEAGGILDVYNKDTYFDRTTNELTRNGNTKKIEGLAVYFFSNGDYLTFIHQRGPPSAFNASGIKYPKDFRLYNINDELIAKAPYIKVITNNTTIEDSGEKYILIKYDHNS